MNKEFAYTVRNITEEANPDSVKISKLSSGLYNVEVKGYGSLATEKGKTELIERIRATVQALEVLYPTAENKVKAELAEAKERIEELEIELGCLKDQSTEGRKPHPDMAP